jgi:uncharacterized protein YbjT (DUF2867 family)
VENNMAGQTPTTEPILVFGATGKQGGAVARHLAKSGFRVRAVTREPDRPAARALAEASIEVVKGDLNDRDSVEKVMRGAYGVFSVQDFWTAGFDTEVAQGTLVAEVARSSGVQHFVYSSVASADRSTGLAHFDSKWIIEQRIHELGLPSTILRPVFFMENWEYVRGHILNGTLPQPLEPDCALQQVATEDIGAIAALAFCNAGRWLGRVVELAGDALTMRQTADAFSRALGRKVEYVQVPWDAFAQATCREMAKMYHWFQDVGYEADMHALRQEYPDLKTLDQFIHEQQWVRAEVSAGSYV